jgi:hypothetical protein
VRIRLTIGDQEVTGVLEDNPATRDLVSMLPITVPMGDLFGREKPGALSRPLTGDVEPVFTYRVGQIAYWPPSHDILVVYAGDGLQVPAPGLIPLGTVDTGLDVIAAAGDDFAMTVTVVDQAGRTPTARRGSSRYPRRTRPPTCAPVGVPWRRAPMQS